MDVSPKALREVEFREKMRGYHPEDVDQFLERVAAGMEVLQDRLRQALERAQRAEQAAAEVGGNDEALRRTLVLAQRTADLAVQEAREQAARILASAEQQAQALVAEAEERGRRSHEEAVAEARTEMTKLEATRQQLQAEVDGLSRWVDEHRSHLALALHEALTRIEQTELLSPPPKTRPADIPQAPNRATAPPAEQGPQRHVNGGSNGGNGHNDEAAGPPTMAWRPDDEDEDDKADLHGGNGDPYFAELRRAINAPEPLGPRDDQPSIRAGNDEDDDEFYDPEFADARRFGGRLRRRR
jgi:cell division initiation protein